MEAQQDEQYYDQQPYPQQAPPMMGHTSETALPIHLDSDLIVEDIIHVLRNEVARMEDGKVVWITPEGTTPIINEKGINSITTILKSHLNKIFILSDLERENIEQMTINIGNIVIDDLDYNWDKYDVRDTAAASLIVNLVTNTVYATLRKGFGGNYLKFLRTISSVSEHQTIMQQGGRQNQPKGDGVLAKLFGKKRR